MRKKKAAVIMIFSAFVALFFAFDLDRFISLEALKTHREALRSFSAEHQLVTAVSFILLYILQTALALPGAIIFSLASGVLFGAMLGTVYAVTAATLGAVAAFLVTRFLFQEPICKKFGDRLTKLNGTLEKEGIHYLLFLRLVPLFPFFLINLGAAVTHMPLRTFFLGTAIGIIPGAFVYVNAGASLASIHSIGDVASPRVLGSFVLLGVFALVPVAYQRLRKKWKRPVEPEQAV